MSGDAGPADRYASPFPRPAGRERELLDVLAEECAEVAQRVSKANRFGLAEVQSGQALTNAQRLAQEAGDLLCLLDWLVARGTLDPAEIARGRADKDRKLRRWLQTEEEPGRAEGPGPRFLVVRREADGVLVVTRSGLSREGAEALAARLAESEPGAGFRAVAAPEGRPRPEGVDSPAAAPPRAIPGPGAGGY